MKNILLPTDFSKNSINAMHYALKLFSGSSCNFFLLHTQSPGTYLSDDLLMAGNQSLYETIVKTSNKKLSQLIKSLKAKYETASFNFEPIIDYDSLPEAINQIIVSKKIDLIVMGTNGVTGAKEVLFGSNTINVIRKVYCPTLIIPEDFAFSFPKEILLALDPLDSLESQAFLKLVKFMERFNEKIHLLRLVPDDESYNHAKKDKKDIDILLKGISYEYHVIRDIPISTAVDCYVQTHTIGLLALLVQDESIFDRLFLGSPTTKISNELRVPLLIFHN